MFEPYAYYIRYVVHFDGSLIDVRMLNDWKAILIAVP